MPLCSMLRRKTKYEKSNMNRRCDDCVWLCMCIRPHTFYYSNCLTLVMNLFTFAVSNSSRLYAVWAYFNSATVHLFVSTNQTIFFFTFSVCLKSNFIIKLILNVNKVAPVFTSFTSETVKINVDACQINALYEQLLTMCKVCLVRNRTHDLVREINFDFDEQNEQ